MRKRTQKLIRKHLTKPKDRELQVTADPDGLPVIHSEWGSVAQRINDHCRDLVEGTPELEAPRHRDTVEDYLMLSEVKRMVWRELLSKPIVNARTGEARSTVGDLRVLLAESLKYQQELEITPHSRPDKLKGAKPVIDLDRMNATGEIAAIGDE